MRYNFPILILSLILSATVITKSETLARAPIAISTNVRVGNAPLTVRVKVTVLPDLSNRYVCFGYDGPQTRTSCAEHVGDTAPTTIWQTYSEIPEGRYVFGAAVFRADGSMKEAVTGVVCVTGPTITADECFPSLEP